MNNVEEFLGNIRTMGITGHIRSDGDAVGTCMALYLYVRRYHPGIAVDVFLDQPRDVFAHIHRIHDVKLRAPDPEKHYDLFVSCDVSALDRLACGLESFRSAGHTVCIDHHASNIGFADENHIEGEISSCSEVLYGLIDPDRVDCEIATALYTGMIHDTGVFQYSSTTPKTMRIAAKLMETGFDFNKIIDDSFYRRTYAQNRVMGHVLTESILLMDGRCIVGYLKQQDMELYGVTSKDLDGIVNQLRMTEGVETAIFLYELENQRFKVSLRSNALVDVSQIAQFFGGGGHKRAAGFDLTGSVHDVINNVTGQLERWLLENGYE